MSEKENNMYGEDRSDWSAKSGDRREDPTRSNGNKKDVDAERHPEEQVVRSDGYKRSEQKYKDKSDRD